MRRDTQRIFDEYLATSARAGDRDAWQRLVERWQPRLLRHAWRLCGDPEQARDRTQEAWLEIFRGLRRLDDVAAFPAWAFRIVTRLCQRAYRRAGRDPLDGAEPPDAMEMATAAHEGGEHAAEVANVLAAMRELPPAQRAALALFHLEHLGVAEISIALDIPPGTVKTRLMHARRKIRARLGETSDEQD